MTIMELLEKDYAGHTYRFGRMPAMDQLHVSRKLAPLVTAHFSELFKMLQEQSSDKVTLSDFVDVAKPVLFVVSKMENTEVEYIIRTCLATVHRRQDPDGWAAVQTASGALMFSDLDMMAMLRLTMEVVRFNLGPFLQTLLAGVASRAKGQEAESSSETSST